MQAKTKTTVAVFDNYLGEKTGKTIPAGTVFGYLLKQGTWLQLTSGAWVNAGASWQYIELLPSTPPPTDPGPTTPPGVQAAKHVILVEEGTGRISVDGLPYA
jgi:hypothetical protein